MPCVSELARRIACALAAAVALGVPASARALELYVVAHPDVRVTPEDLKEIYLGDLLFSASTRFQPVHNTALQTGFVTRVLGMTQARYDTWWARKSFKAGLTPPAAVGGNREIIEFVRRTPGAIGYVTAKPDAVRIILNVSFDEAPAGASGGTPK